MAGSVKGVQQLVSHSHNIAIAQRSQILRVKVALERSVLDLYLAQPDLQHMSGGVVRWAEPCTPSTRPANTKVLKKYGPNRSYWYLSSPEESRDAHCKSWDAWGVEVSGIMHLLDLQSKTT